LHNSHPEGYAISTILSVLDNKPYVNEKQLKFWEWLADYYMCTPGEIFRAALPSGLRLESESQIYISDKGDTKILTRSENQILEVAARSPGISIMKLTASLGKKDIMTAIKNLMERGFISLKESLVEVYKPRLQQIVVLTELYRNSEKLQDLLTHFEKKAPKQARLVLEFLHLCEYPDEVQQFRIVKDKLLISSGCTSSTLNTLVAKGIFRVENEEISRLTYALPPQRKPYALNSRQTNAHVKILDEFETKNVVLLYGITSSGKTEIYIHLIEHFIRQNKQVLYLLPEIALTTQIIQRLRSVFGDKIGVYHSKFSDAERVEVFQNLSGFIKKGSPKYQIILGVRSSVFLPFSDLGLIIVDEEHENTYKQFDPAPRYNARDAAVVLAGIHNGKVLMGTATPSFESYLNVANERYGYVELFERYLDIKLPEITLIDMREARKRKQVYSHFSNPLLDAIEETLSRKEQVILFQNRRGFSPYIECNTCGLIPYCKNCDVSLTYHKKSNRLHCHYCGYSIPHPSKCSACGSQDIRTHGFGTEKIEDEIAILFPKAKLARLDLDSARTRRTYEKIISDFENRKIDILIGTQMISKGLDFDHVRIVGILDADSMLNFPDFRSFERSYQLMAQVSGRAGRKKEQGKVIIQTSDPNHIVLVHLLENDYKGFFRNQLKERVHFKYPPYYRMIKLTLRHRKLPVLIKAANYLAGELRKSLGDRVVGPESPLISRLYNLHQKCILIKIDRDKHITERRHIVQNAIDKTRIHSEFKSLHIVPDVDPYN
jgi:primosomal protein N' (replication factor Y)